MKNQMIYPRTDDPKFIITLMNLRKNYNDNRPIHSPLGKIYVTELWDKNHGQKIASNSKLLDKARNFGVHEARHSYVKFQELLERHQLIEKRTHKKGNTFFEAEINVFGAS